MQPIFSIDQQHNFNSIIGLVNYYSQNILKDNFPQLDTTLGVAYRDALPPPIGIATAMHDYNPIVNPNNTGDQVIKSFIFAIRTSLIQWNLILLSILT